MIYFRQGLDYRIVNNRLLLSDSESCHWRAFENINRTQESSIPAYLSVNTELSCHCHRRDFSNQILCHALETKQGCPFERKQLLKAGVVVAFGVASKIGNGSGGSLFVLIPRVSSSPMEYTRLSSAFNCILQKELFLLRVRLSESHPSSSVSHKKDKVRIFRPYVRLFHF